VATLALQRGLHPKVVSEILGHSSVSITLDTYSHAIPTLSETAVALVADLLTGGMVSGGFHRGALAARSDTGDKREPASYTGSARLRGKDSNLDS
jgi:hypothetical protein